MTAVPYPADVRAKGWRFEIDYEKVEQSDTWSLAAEVPMAQHALLMMWMMAWTQVPCGSMPNDESLIRAKCRIPVKQWAALKPILMRGWWAADDGRLYHDTVVLRVQEMMARRRSDSDRKARNRSVTPPDVTRDKGVTDGGIHQESSTGTGTGTGTSPSLRSGESSRASAGEACMAMKAAGMPAVNPSNPKLIALLEAGITVAELASAAADSPGKPFAYALAVAEGRRRDAKTAPLPMDGVRGAGKYAAAAAGIFDQPRNAEVIDV